MPRKLIDKKLKKRSDKKCYFCDVSDYAQLNVHRIVYGEQGGRYTEWNSLVVCANCHARIHDGQIVIDKKYNSSTGTPVLHYWEDGQEKWD